MKWQVKPEAPSAFFEQFPEFSPLTKQLLYNRGIKTQQQIDEFFNSDFNSDLHDPFLLKGMEKAVKRVEKAIKKKEKITIYGDFDADGICSTVILYNTLKKLGVKKLDAYIPCRGKENHGLNDNAINELNEKGTNLIITVDCASTDYDEIDLVNSLGMDIIVTDHHQVGKLPKCVSLVNPLQKDETYPFRELVGAGVVYKLSCALFDELKKDEDKVFQKWLLDLTAIATVADVANITGENRTIVKYGLGVLAQSKWIGLQELMKVSKIDPKILENEFNGKAPLTNLDTRTIGFVIGPRLNAASRMDHANNAFYLLTEENRERAKKAALEIDKNNADRQNLTSKVFKEAESRLKNINDLKLIFEGDKDWPIGLVGLIAGKVKDKYNLPTVIYNEGKDTIHASCRTNKEFDLVKMLKKASKYFDDFGARRCTGGFRMKKENFEKVKIIFEREAERQLKDEDLRPVLDIDKELLLEDINWENYEQIRKFEPFGRGNKEPRFLARKLEICSLKTVGNGHKHLKMELMMFCDKSSKCKKFNAIAFGFGDKGDMLESGQLVDAVFELIINEWNGHRDLEMKIVDLKISE